MTSFATIKPVPLTSENAKRVRATPVEDTAMGATFCLKNYFFDLNERATPKGGSSPLRFNPPPTVGLDKTKGLVILYLLNLWTHIKTKK